MPSRIAAENWIKTWFVYFALLFYSGALLRPLNGNEDISSLSYRTTTSGSGTFSVQVIGAVIMLIATGILFAKRARPPITRELILVTALVVLALVSAFWSNSALLCFRRALAMGGTILFAFALSASFTRQQILRVLSRFSVYFIFAILAFTLLLPGSSFTTATGIANMSSGTALLGPFPQKNELGLALGLVLTILGSCGRKYVGGKLWLAAMGAGVIMLFASESMGNVSALLAAFAVLFVLDYGNKFRSRKDQVSVVALLALFVAPFVLFWNNVFHLVLGLMGRDATLSDRTVIWQLLIPAGEKTWLLGRGYGTAFVGSVSDDLMAGMHSYARNAHNGYIETWLELGVVGLTLVALLLVSIFVRLLANSRSIKTDGFVRMSVCVFAFYIVTNITSAKLINYDEINWAMLVTIGYVMSLGAVEKPIVREARLYADTPALTMGGSVRP